MRRSIQRVSRFFSWLLTQQREIFKQRAKYYPFRIVAIRRLPLTGETIFTVQFVGKSTCVKLKADELAEDDRLIQGFSPSDVKQIIEAALVQEKLRVISGGKSQEPFKILSKNFSGERMKPSYLVEETRGSRRSTKTVNLEEVTQSKEILLKFSKQDIYEIAYTAGEQSVTNAQNEIDEAKK